MKLLSIEPWWVQCMGLFDDGTVRKIYLVPKDPRYCYTYEIGEDLGWRNVTSLCSSRSHLTGLTGDGKVLVEAGSSYRFCEVETWKNVKSIGAGYESIAGVFEDGTLLYTYNGNDDSFQCSRKNVIDITVCARTVYGIDEEGTLFETMDGETRILVKNCGKVIQLGAIARTIYGLTAKGYVKALYGKDDDMKNWSCVTRIASGDEHLLGLTDSGKVLWKGRNMEQAEALNPDSKIIDIFTGCYHSLAINEEGCLFSPKNYWFG